MFKRVSFAGTKDDDDLVPIVLITQKKTGQAISPTIGSTLVEPNRKLQTFETRLL